MAEETGEPETSDQMYIKNLKQKIENLEDKLKENEEWKQNKLLEHETLRIDMNRMQTKHATEMSLFTKLQKHNKKVENCLKIITTRSFVRNVRNRKHIVSAHRTLSNIIINTIKNSEGNTVALADAPALRSQADLDEVLKKTSRVSDALVASRVSVGDCLTSMSENIDILKAIVDDFGRQVDHWKSTADSHFSRTIVLSNEENIVKKQLKQVQGKLDKTIAKLKQKEDEIQQMRDTMADERAARLEQEKKKRLADARKDLSEAKDVAILAERARTLRDKVRELEVRCNTLEVKRERLLKAAQSAIPPPLNGSYTDRGRRRPKRYVEEMHYLNAWALKAPTDNYDSPPYSGLGRRRKQYQCRAVDLENNSIYNTKLGRPRKGNVPVRRIVPDHLNAMGMETA